MWGKGGEGVWSEVLNKYYKCTSLSKNSVVKCTVAFLRLPQRGLCFSCCKAGFPQQHLKGNKGSCKPCKPTTGTPASHIDMTIQCYWGWGLHWSQMGCLNDKSFLCDSISHWGSRKKSLSDYACVFGESIQSRNTKLILHWLELLWQKTPEVLNYSWFLTRIVHCDLCDH